MNYTFTPHTGDGSTKVFSFSLAGQDTGYVQRSDINVFVGGVAVPFTLSLQTPNQVTITTAPPVGAEILIRRIVPKTNTYTDFQSGNPFTADNLNKSFLQGMYLQQEWLDGFLPVGFYLKQNVDVGGHKFTNMAEGTVSGDSVNYDQWYDHELRIEGIEGDLTGVTSRTIPYYYIATGGETRWAPSGRTFDSAIVFINGVFQNQNLGAFNITSNGFNFAEPLVKGDEVYALIGSTPATGDMINDQDVEVIQPYSGAVKGNQHIKNSESVSVLDFGAVAGGSVVNDIAFINAGLAGGSVLVPSGTYRLSSPMVLGYTARYFGEGVLVFDNAEWWRVGGSAGSGVNEMYTLFYEYPSQSAVSVTFDGVTQPISFVDNYTVSAPPSTSAVSVKINIAGGMLRLGSAPESVRSYNVLSNGGHLVSPSLPNPTTSPVGMMNTSLGSRSLPNLTTGENNTALGARTLVSTTSGNNNTGVGFQSLYRASGSDNTALGSVSAEWLTTGQQNTYLGANAGGHARTASFNTGVGWSALGDNIGGSYNTAVGWRAGGNTDTVDFSESVMVGAFCGSFSWGGKNTYAGYRAGAGVNSGSDGTENVAVGFFAMRQHNGADYNTAIGVSSMTTITNGQYNTAIGHSTGGSLTTSIANTLVGYRAGYVLTSDGNTLIGFQSGAAITTGGSNVGIGNGTLATNTTGTNNTAVGVNSGRLTTAGASTVGLTNTTTLGNDARVSGDNQLQLGNSTVTPYAYAALQLRSDSRDKAEVRDTDLGIDFILGLRPVRGKWNLRDDYYSVGACGATTFDEVGYKSKTKMRSREHEWFIAQDVEELCEKLGVDFAGLQHAKVNGGEDVYSLGYTDFIPPITKAVQECWSRIDELESRLNKLENKED